MQSTATDGAAGLIDISDEPTKHLCNRLKVAGDDVWLSKETDEETKSNEENCQSLPNDIEKDVIKQEEEDDDNHESLNEKMLEKIKPFENSNNPPNSSIKIEQVSEDEASSNQKKVTVIKVNDESPPNEIKNEDTIKS